MPPALGRQPCFKDSFLTAVARAGPRERKDKQETERLFIKLTGSVRNKGGLLSNVQTSRKPGEQRKLVPCLPGEPRRAGDNSTPVSKKEEKSHKCHMSQTASTCEKDQTGQRVFFSRQGKPYHLQNHTEESFVWTSREGHMALLVSFQPQHSSPHIRTGLNLRVKTCKLVKVSRKKRPRRFWEEAPGEAVGGRRSDVSIVVI